MFEYPPATEEVIQYVMRSQPFRHQPPPALRAAIYGPTHQIGRWQPTCTAWCTARRYDLVSVVDLLHAMADGDINIAMVATLAGLPADRMARVETIGRRQPVRRGSS